VVSFLPVRHRFKEVCVVPPVHIVVVGKAIHRNTQACQQ
jgi:hypothetical protein